MFPLRASTVTTPARPKTLFPDIPGPPKLLVVSFLPGAFAMNWCPKGLNDIGCTAIRVMLESVAGTAMRYNGKLGLYFEVQSLDRQLLEALQSTAIAFASSPPGTPRGRVHLDVEYLTPRSQNFTAISIVRRILNSLPSQTITGFVLCDHASNRASVNAAQMMAWKLNALIVDVNLPTWKSDVLSLGLKQVADVRNFTDRRIASMASTWPVLNFGFQGSGFISCGVATGGLSWSYKYKAWKMYALNGPALQPSARASSSLPLPTICVLSPCSHRSGCCYLFACSFVELHRYIAFSRCH